MAHNFGNDTVTPFLNEYAKLYSWSEELESNTQLDSIEGAKYLVQSILKNKAPYAINIALASSTNKRNLIELSEHTNNSISRFGILAAKLLDEHIENMSEQEERQRNRQRSAWRYEA